MKAESQAAPRSAGGLILLAMLPALLAYGWMVQRLAPVWSERPELEFGWIVLCLSVYLVFDRWPTRPPVVLRRSWLQFAAAAGSLALLFLVQISWAAFGLTSTGLLAQALASLVLGAACLHLVFGWPGVRHFGFAAVFFLVALPIPSAINSPVIAGLQAFITSANVEILNTLGIAAQRVGNLIHLAGGTVGVNEACSGIRSLQSSVMATMFIGYLTLRSGLLRTLLLAGGILVAITGNLLRSLYLCLVANSRGVRSVDTVHDTAGWSILAFTAAGVALLAWRLSRIDAAAQLRGPPDDPPAEPAGD